MTFYLLLMLLVSLSECSLSRREPGKDDLSMDKEKWFELYNRLFHEPNGGDDLSAKPVGELVKLLERLQANTHLILDSDPSGARGAEMSELIKLSHVSADERSCGRYTFASFDSLAKKYASNVVISKFISHFQDQLWLLCLSRYFIKGQRSNGLVNDDETEAFSMVDYVLAANRKLDLSSDKETDQLHSDIKVAALERGIIGYVKAKLGKDSRDRGKIDELFVNTIAPVCGSVRFRFVGMARVEDLIEQRDDLRKQLDSRSLKWLMAKRLCKNILDKLVYLREKVATRKSLAELIQSEDSGNVGYSLLEIIKRLYEPS